MFGIERSEKSIADVDVDGADVHIIASTASKFEQGMPKHLCGSFKYLLVEGPKISTSNDWPHLQNTVEVVDDERAAVTLLIFHCYFHMDAADRVRTALFRRINERLASAHAENDGVEIETARQLTRDDAAKAAKDALKFISGGECNLGDISYVREDDIGRVRLVWRPCSYVTTAAWDHLWSKRPRRTRGVPGILDIDERLRIFFAKEFPDLLDEAKKCDAKVDKAMGR